MPAAACEFASNSDVWDGSQASHNFFRWSVRRQTGKHKGTLLQQRIRGCATVAPVFKILPAFRMLRNSKMAPRNTLSCAERVMLIMCSKRSNRVRERRVKVDPAMGVSYHRPSFACSRARGRRCVFDYTKCGRRAFFKTRTPGVSL